MTTQSAVDVKELYAYDETKNKSKDFTETAEEQEKSGFIKHRIFINQVDEFNSRNIAAFITDQMYGATKEDDELGEEMGEEQMMEEELEPKSSKFLGPAYKFEVIGTLKYDFHKKSEDILAVLNESNRDAFEEAILNCGFVIFDITQDKNEIPKALNALQVLITEIEKISAIGPKTLKEYENVRVFILVSTVMTWAKSKPIDPDEPETPFTESDFKKRRPHPNYEEHIDAERSVILAGRKYKDKLKTYVICSGIIYGNEEEDLNFLFKLAWRNEKYLPIFQPGTNFVPLIHIKDLAKIIHGVCENAPRKPQYILAVELTPSKLKDIVKAISKAMGSGKTRDVNEAEAFLYDDISQKDFERCTVNLPMEPSYVVDNLEIEWQSENLVENMAKIVTEFRNSRNLKPYRIIIHGPPGVGKTTLAQKLSEYYGCKYISIKNLIQETIENLRENIELAKEKLKLKSEMDRQKKVEDEDEEGEEEEEDEEDDAEMIEEWKEQLRDIEETLEESDNGKLPDEYVIRMLKAVIRSNECQNQGYVLDGYPKTTQQALELFGKAGEEGEEAGEDDEDVEFTSGLLPDKVLALKATDESLCKRIMSLPEHIVQGTHYTEEAMLRRLSEFRAINTEDNTVLNFFNENEIHPVIINGMDEIEMIFAKAKGEIGPYVGFTVTEEEAEELLRLEEEKNRLMQDEENLKKTMLKQEEEEKHKQQMEEWTKNLERLQMEEEKILAVQCEPLRNYLIKYVFPTLAKGLINVAKIKPKDPIDYLAEYLFKENPEGHMFDPSYTKDGELLMSEVKENVEDILKEILDQTGN